MGPEQERRLAETVREDRKRIRRAKDVRYLGIGMACGSILMGLATGGPTEGTIVATLIGLVLFGLSFVLWKPRYWKDLDA